MSIDTFQKVDTYVCIFDKYIRYNEEIKNRSQYCVQFIIIYNICVIYSCVH